MAESLDLYTILQVGPRAPLAEIRAAYRALARQHHPDLAGGSHEKMAALNNAWSVLSDPVARAEYDRGRHAAMAATPTPPRPTDRPAAEPCRAAVGGHRSGSVLDFGRYAGWSLGELAHHDPDFLEWLARASAGRRYRGEIEVLLRPRPATATAVGPERRPARFRRG